MSVPTLGSPSTLWCSLTLRSVLRQGASHARPGPTAPTFVLIPPVREPSDGGSASTGLGGFPPPAADSGAAGGAPLVPGLWCSSAVVAARRPRFTGALPGRL